MGFPIQTSLDHRLVATFPELFAGSNVFHRLQLPRHPPYALSRLTINLNSSKLCLLSTKLITKTHSLKQAALARNKFQSSSDIDNDLLSPCVIRIPLRLKRNSRLSSHFFYQDAIYAIFWFINNKLSCYQKIGFGIYNIVLRQRYKLSAFSFTLLKNF